MIMLAGHQNQQQCYIRCLKIIEDFYAVPVQHINVVNETITAMVKRLKFCSLKMLSVCGCHTNETKSKLNYLKAFLLQNKQSYQTDLGSLNLKYLLIKMSFPLGFFRLNFNSVSICLVFNLLTQSQRQSFKEEKMCPVI